ncbi:L,D-transpeptidase family protein [Dinoroseobacter sp. PD6]|uniref:L,D-transpeptidase family protein n=1 Tax=Dinoroseobacter sp. PD6 TaxID=3028384 RepID=UPI00237AA2DD|nr:L,D-transpeptidase family protein [Dinoroseobacter sp. PD6]MDD9718054.1 L,D-transpeptidase family protein [Dinoroseobacter sp. PD6]
MTLSRRVLLLGLALGLSGCGSSKFLDYEGPEVTRIVVFKGERRMYLMNEDRVLRGFDIDLGFAPQGHKQVEGDGKTPEGRYRIDRRNPNSSFHLSLGISYPNTADVARARAMGQSPGGNIFIHGQPNLLGPQTEENWTAGCIAVTNAEMEEIYAMVEDGTVIDIYP